MKKTILSIAASDIKPRFLRVPAAVKYSGLSRSHIYELITARKVASHSVGRARLIDRISLDRYIKGCPKD